MLQEIALKMHEFRELQSQSDLLWTHNTYLCKLHFIKQLNEGLKSLVACIGHTFCHAQHVCLHGGVSMTGGGSQMKFKLQKHVYEYFFKKNSQWRYKEMLQIVSKLLRLIVNN